MRFRAFSRDGAVTLARVMEDGGLVDLGELLRAGGSDLRALVGEGADTAMLERVDSVGARPSAAEPGDRARPVVVAPGMIVGIGLNYRDHASDLDAELPTEPATFIKSYRTVAAPGTEIVLPPASARVTAEAELGLVIGRTAWQVAPEEALDHVLGGCAILDQTAEDILRRNPRFLTRSKNFPTFLVIGSELVTIDELQAREGGLDGLTVETRHNGSVAASNQVDNMTFSPAEIVSTLSQALALMPGDVICTGTPGAVHVEDGDVVECRIDGFSPLTMDVRRPGPEAYTRRMESQQGVDEHV